MIMRRKVTTITDTGETPSSKRKNGHPAIQPVAGESISHAMVIGSAANAALVTLHDAPSASNATQPAVMEVVVGKNLHPGQAIGSAPAVRIRTLRSEPNVTSATSPRVQMLR